MDVLLLAKTLIDISSISGGEEPMVDFLEPYLLQRGWQVQRQMVGPGRPNLFAHRGKPNPRLLFNSHLDTVPPFFPARIEGEWLYGRGACDTKGLIAAQLLAAQALVEQGEEDIGLLYVVGEEVDHCGMIAACHLGLTPEALLVAEPTEALLARRQKGMLKMRLNARGVAAHSGYPQCGASAIHLLLEVLCDLRNATWPASVELGETTLNIGRIGGGRAANVLADEAWAELMFRVVSSWEEIARMAENLVAGRCEIEAQTACDPAELDQLPGYPSGVVAFNTDIPYFPAAKRAFLFGHGSILDAHTAQERIRIADLDLARQSYQALALAILNS
jgi:acetylornithine deacetylase